MIGITTMMSTRMLLMLLILSAKDSTRIGCMFLFSLASTEWVPSRTM